MAKLKAYGSRLLPHHIEKIKRVAKKKEIKDAEAHRHIIDKFKE